MRSDRKNRITRTFRFRLAALHVLLVSAALVATFVLSSLLVNSFAKNQSQRSLGNLLQQAKQLYLGEDPPQSDETLPADDFQRLEAKIPGFRIGMIDRETTPNGLVYEVTGSTGSEHMEVFVEPAGRIWITKRTPLAEVFSQMTETLDTNAKHPISLFVFSSKGSLLTGTDPGDSPTGELLKEILREGIPPNGTVIKSKESLWVGVARLYDGNLVAVADPFDEFSGMARLWSRFFLILSALFLPLSGGIGYYISRRAMAGVERVTATARRVREGHLGERVAVGSEGYEIEALASGFNEMLERIEVLMQELQSVTTNIAHDLRTPMARIRGMAESLDWAELSPEKRRQTTSQILEECDRMMPLIESILELARLETGMQVLLEEPVDLAAEVSTAHALFSGIAEDRKIDFSCSVPDGPVWMVGDRSRMQRVISNLLDNALKFTPEGKQVSIALEQDGTRATLRVADTGPGIPPEELERVFERFYRVDRSRSTPGHGLGLSMVNAFVKAYGGQVVIDSQPSRGCTVTVTFPLSK